MHDATTPSTAAITPTKTAEGFWGVFIRRARYAAAITLGGLLFYYVGWLFAVPPAAYGGVSLTAWSVSGGLTAAAALFGLLVAALLLSMLIAHPDAPYVGPYCAFLGLAGLAIHGGDISALTRLGQTQNTLGTIYQRLAIECVQWAIILFLVEIIARGLYARFFSNIRWLERLGADEHKLKVFKGRLPMYRQTPAHVEAPGSTRPHLAEQFFAFGIACVAAFVALHVTMQSQTKGQVLFACLASFFIAGLAARYFAPHADTWPVIFSVPAVAAFGYLSARSGTNTGELVFPGHAYSTLARALPIDYLSAGVPGAILGYALAMKLQLHQHLFESAESKSA